MTKESLDKAEALGINTEGLTQSQLNKAIDKAEKANQQLDTLKSEAKEFGIDVDGKSAEELALAIQTVKDEKIRQEENEQFRRKASLLAAFFEISDLALISEESLKEFLSEASEKIKAMGDELDRARNLNVTSAEVVDDGRSDKKFKIGETEFQFSEEAPGTFRFLGKLQSQKAWLKDADALELMVATNISYVKPAKN